MQRCGSASVAAKPGHFEDLSDLRVSDLRTVNGNLEPFAPYTITNLQENFDKLDKKRH
jgi:hypothetical protein